MKLITFMMAVLVTISSARSSNETILTLHKVVRRDDLEVVIAGDRSRWDFNLSGDINIARLYYANVALGSPPQQFRMGIDTGSSLPWIDCINCYDCAQYTYGGVKYNFFDVSKSATGLEISCSDRPTCACSDQANLCSYTVNYMDGSSISGHLVTDLLHLQSISTNSSSPFLFGCSTRKVGTMANGVLPIDGLLGFGPGQDSVIQQISSQGGVRKVFSHCLRGDDDQGGGQLVLGEVVHPSMVYSSLIPSEVGYSIKLEGISVNGKLLPTVLDTKKGAEMLVDSGTSLAYFSEEIFQPLITAISALVNPHLNASAIYGNLCYELTASEFKLFPQVTLQFAGGASMLMNPKDYLIKRLFLDGYGWCIGIQKVQAGGISILGDLLLRDKIIVYDLDQQRLGWTNFNCSLRLTTSNAGRYSLSSRRHIRLATLFIVIAVIFL